MVNLDLPIDVSETETRELLGGKKDTLPKEGPLICPPGKINCIKKKATEKIELVARPKTESSEDGHRSDGFVDGPRLTISCQGLLPTPE